MPGPFQLPALPWDESSLAPTISAKTLSLHYGKHHLAYVNKLNELVAGTPYADQSLEQIITATKAKPDAKKIYNNAGQTWNHNFYWNCLSPNAGGEPKGGIGKQLEPFGGYDGFCKQFAQAAVDQFGSGWAWLVSRDGKLEIVTTSNADNPLTMGATPLLTIDVWEHAYYVDYENRRPDHVKAVIEKLLNWKWAEECLAKGGSQRKAA